MEKVTCGQIVHNMKITIANKIKIENAPKKVLTTIKSSLTLANPLYFKMMKMGNISALYNLPQFFKYYDETNNALLVGRGYETKLINFLNKNNYDYERLNSTNEPRFQHDFSTKIKLRTYQKGDIDVIKQFRNGIIRLGTGYGKTIISVKLIDEIQVPTCIIVPRTHLIQQFCDTFKTYSKYEPGIIQGKNWNIKEITIASIQTLGKRHEGLLKIKDKFGMVIVDECHTMITNKRLEVIQSFNPKYLFGLTATPRRTDQQDKAIFFTFGDIVISKDMEKAKPEVKLLYTNTPIPILENYAEMIDEQVKNKDRNEIIVNTIKNEIEKGRKIIVLTKRITHYKLLAKRFKDYRTYSINSKDNAKNRSNLLQKLREGKSDFSIIFGTYSMLSTGTDIPALDTLFFVGDLRSDVLQEQSAGRILRLFRNKLSPKIIDFIDNKNGILYNQAKSRIKFYKLMKWL